MSLPTSHLLLQRIQQSYSDLFCGILRDKRDPLISFTYIPRMICFSNLFPISNVNEDAPVAAAAAGRNARGQLVIHRALFIIILNCLLI